MNRWIVRMTITYTYFVCVRPWINEMSKAKSRSSMTNVSFPQGNGAKVSFCRIVQVTWRSLLWKLMLLQGSSETLVPLTRNRDESDICDPTWRTSDIWPHDLHHVTAWQVFPSSIIKQKKNIVVLESWRKENKNNGRLSQPWLLSSICIAIQWGYW